MSDEIPAPLKTFLEKNIHSIWILELLLFMWKNTDREWKATEVNQQLRGTIHSTQACLDNLVTKNILVLKEPPPLYRFNSNKAGLNEMVALLSKFYLDHRNKIIDFIYSPAEPISKFADAIVLRKEKKDG